MVPSCTPSTSFARLRFRVRPATSLTKVRPGGEPTRRLNEQAFVVKPLQVCALAQDHAGWRKLVTKPPFKLGKLFMRQPRGDTRVTPEDKKRLAKERAAEIARQRADFNATIN